MMRRRSINGALSSDRRTVRLLAVVALASLCAGCSGWQAALDPKGEPAENLGRLITLIVVVCAVVWALVITALVGALRRRRPAPYGPKFDSNSGSERRLAIAVGAATVATVLIITSFTIASFFATRGLATTGGDDLVIKVRGAQWWWEIRYLDGRADADVVTANEIHIPVGRRVRFQLEASDVIHSFWVPALAGKQDLVPGRPNQLSLMATTAGVYRGQCAEFCGLQHAHMAFLVIAEEPAVFDAWRAAQAKPASPPADAEQVAGRQVFEARACAACHAIRGTPAAGVTGPDLTHIGSRRTIGAGLFETTRGSLAAWIADPQTLKPGNNMPRIALSPDELKAVSAYLAGLQ